MGETCFHVPARVFGFESSESGIAQPQKASPGGGLELRHSLLSSLLKGEAGAPLPSAFMDTSDAYSEDEDDDMEEGDCDGEEREEGDDETGAHSAPVPIPSSDTFIKAQREALKRFVYAHQIDEMRRAAAAYFARTARQEASNDCSTATNQPASTALAEKKDVGSASGRSQRKPGF